MVKRLTELKTLGPISAKVINTLIEQDKEIFTLEDASKIYGKSRSQTIHFLKSLVNRKVLARIKSGIFLILKTGQEKIQLNNWPIIASILTSPHRYYISHYSAMRLHGMTTHPLTNVIITIPIKRKLRIVSNITYQYIFLKPEYFWGLTKHWVTRQEYVWVSDIERTILDCLERSDLSGGIKEISNGIWSKQNQIDWNKLLEYALKFQTIAAVKRLGFLLETLNLGTTYTQELREIIKEKKDYILLEPNAKKEGKYLQRWYVRINVNIDELKKGVWG